MSANSCGICGAVVAVDLRELHMRWHHANGLHAANCPQLLTELRQRSTDAYLIPQACTCPFTALDGEQ